MLYPYKFIPIYKNYIWGGRNLETLGKPLPNGTIAESWEISSHSDGESIIANGKHKGKTLSDLTKELGVELLGTALQEMNIKKFPLLIKFIDANQKLSVQVHPNNKYAKKNENGQLGKNEVWYIVSAKPGSKIIQGISPNVTREIFIKAIKNGTIEKYLNYIEVLPGDTVSIPSGLVHSLGEGIVALEIQQSSNITYRVFDYNRLDSKGNKRELHIEKALAIIDFNNCNISGTQQGLKISLQGNSYKIFLLANKYFSVEKYDIKGKIEENADGNKFFAYTCLSGNGKIIHTNGTENIKTGESLLIPAFLGKYIIEGNIELIKSYVPNINVDIASPLVNTGYSLETIEKYVLNL